MKTIITSILLACSALIMAQNTGNAVIFSNSGQRFIVILNGARINENFETNVKLTNLNAEFYKIKLLFEKGVPKQKEFNLYVHLGREITYELKNIKNNSKYVLRFNSEAPLPPPMPAYVPAPPIGNMGNTSTTPATNNGTIVNVPININIGNGAINTTPNNSGVALPPSAQYGCSAPMNAATFEQAKQSLKSKPFEDNKLQIAKQILNSNCLSCAQVKEIIMLFNFEDSRLDFAKFAYGRTWDYSNYFTVNDAFKFSTSIDDLNAYIQSFQR